MIKRFIIVGNWKMYFSYKQSMEWLEDNQKALEDALNIQELILCPSYDALFSMHEKLSSSPIRLGAQDCSAYSDGAYTGQIQARSLKEIGCQYCIIGHSETRLHLKYANKDIEQKLHQALSNQLTPIVAVGETEEEYEQGITLEVLKNQLKPLVDMTNSQKELYIAYEPIWAIGTGYVASKEHLQIVFDYILSTFPSHKNALKLLYGGSLTSEAIQELKSIENLSGFLIGGSSAKPNELKSIIKILNESLPDS